MERCNCDRWYGAAIIRALTVRSAPLRSALPRTPSRLIPRCRRSVAMRSTAARHDLQTNRNAHR